MDKIELKNLLFLARIHAEEKEYTEITKKLTNTFNLIDEMNNLDLEGLEPLNNPLELNNVSREDEEKNRNQKDKFLDQSPESDDDHFMVPKIIEWILESKERTLGIKKCQLKKLYKRL